MGDLDSLAGKNSYVPGESYHNVSMGQGQDIIAMRILEMAHRQGHWVVLNNVHLMPVWLQVLEKKLDEFAKLTYPIYYLTRDLSSGIYN